MTVKTGQAWAGTFVTLDATGALAAGTPSGVLYVDGTANEATVTITGSNPYKWAVTLPTLTAGQTCDMYITATISTIATASVVASEQADTALISEVKTDTAAILADTGTDGVVLKAAGLSADAVAEIADGVWDEAISGHTTGTTFGGKNQKVVPSETINDYKADVSGIPAAVWSYATRTLSSFGSLIADIWSHVTRTLSSFGFTVATNSDANVTAIKAKTDNLPASPAAVGSAMTLTAAYDKAKDDVLTPLGVVDGIVDAIKVQTDKIPATPASAGEYTANIGAIKAKTDNLPLSPASSGEYTSALTAIQNDLDNPNQYKADVSNLALQATSLAIKGQTDKIPAAPAQTGEYNAALTAIQADLDNPTQYKADVSGLATQASVNAIPTTPLLAANYTAPDNASVTAIKGKTDQLMFDEYMRVIANPTTGELFAARDAILAAIEAIDGGGSSMTPEQIRAAVGLALANLDTQLSGLLTAINSIETDVDLTGIAKTTDVESAKDEVLTAIDDKPVTPVTDISNLATKLDLDVLAKAADLDELLTMLTTVAKDTGTTVPQLVASLPAKVWSYPFRTLTVSAIRPQTLLEGDQFSIYKDTSILIPITALGDISAYDNLWFTAKKEMDLQDGDEKAIIHIDLLTGLLYINQEVADNALGGIRIDDSEAGNIDIWLSKNASALLPLFSKETLRWEVKGISGDNVDILLQGTNYILPAVTRKIS